MDKRRYLESYQFKSETLKSARRLRIVQTKLLLGLRLIEKRETLKERQLVWQGKSFSPTKGCTGLALSLLPKLLRAKAFDVLRQVRSP